MHVEYSGFDAGLHKQVFAQFDDLTCIVDDSPDETSLVIVQYSGSFFSEQFRGASYDGKRGSDLMAEDGYSIRPLLSSLGTTRR